MKFLILALDVNLGRQAGDAIHLQELASSLIQMGHSVDVVVASNNGGVRPGSAEFHVIEGKNLWSVVRRVRPIAAKLQPDVIYERRLSPKVGFVLSRLVRTPLVVEVNGLPDEERSLLLGRNYTPSWFQIRIRRMLLRRAKAIVTVSDSLKRRLTLRYGLPPSSVSVVPNGVNTELFVPMERSWCRNRLGLEDDCPILGFVGSLAPWQGVDSLIRATAEIHRHGTAVRALVVGDGPERPRLESLADSEGLGDRAIFTGTVPYAEVPIYVGAMDVAVSLKPPLLPGSPLKIREYMSCGRPVVASRGTEYDFGIVESAGAGILVDPKNMSEVVGGIMDLLGDETQRTTMGAKGREFAVRNCAWSLTAQQIAAVCGG